MVAAIINCANVAKTKASAAVVNLLGTGGELRARVSSSIHQRLKNNPIVATNTKNSWASVA